MSQIAEIRSTASQLLVRTDLHDPALIRWLVELLDDLEDDQVDRSAFASA